MKKIYVSDITLKELAQQREVSLLFREKTAIAGCSDTLGVSAVELAPIKNLREDTIVYQTISDQVKYSAVAIPVGITPESVQEAWECVKEAKKPRLQVSLPTSTVQMEYTYHMKEEKMLAKIRELTVCAKGLCEDVEFVAQDASRAGMDFLKEACKTAIDAGAEMITLCDDAGIFAPDEMAAFVAEIKTVCEKPIYVQVSDGLSMAVAASLAAINAGADGVKASLAGEGVMLAGKFSDAIVAKGDAMGVNCDLNKTQVHTSVESLVKKIKQDSYAKDAGRASEKDSIFLDADCTLPQVRDAAKLLGYTLTAEDNGNVHKAVLQICEKKSVVSARELEALIASEAMRVPSTYHLESYTATCGTVTGAMAQVVLRQGEERLCGVSNGDGPIDAVFRAIEQSVGHHYELDDFQIQSVTEGKEALGAAVVRLRNNGKLYSGNGTSGDIVGASVRAYINALNKIVYEED